MSIDTYKQPASEPIDQEILKKLDNGFRRLTWARRQYSQSLLKRFLVKSVFHILRPRSTTSGVNLYDIAKSGFDHLDSKIGVFAYNEECYKVFKPILHPVICTIHHATPIVCHPQEPNWSDIEHLESGGLDPQGQYISKITMTVSKNITPYPFVPCMTKSQLESIEREIRGTMKTMTGLTGVYYSLASVPKDVKLILGREDLIFDNTDKFLETAGVYNNWPAGRGVFITHMKDVFIWINQSEHFTLGVTQKDANIKNVFHRLYQTLQSINDSLRWSQDEFWGLMTMSPALIGSGLKIFVYVKLPYLGQEESFRQDLLDQYGLECVKAKHTLSDNRIFVLSNRRTFGLTESEILSSVHRCLKEMIAIEQKFKDSAKGHEA